MPTTNAGRLTLIGFGVGRVDYPGRDTINEQLERAIAAIEAEAVAAERQRIRAGVEGLPTLQGTRELADRGAVLAIVDAEP